MRLSCVYHVNNRVNFIIKNLYIHKTACSVDEFTCKSGSCIPQLAVCDLAKDCPQGDDEENCDCARNEVSIISKAHFTILSFPSKPKQNLNTQNTFPLSSNVYAAACAFH